MKSGSKALAIGLLFIGLVLVNYLASSLPVRLDLTAESIYSLSPGTKAILSKIEEPIILDLYFSKNATGLPILYKNYAARVQEMLRQYVRAAHSKLTLNVINPRPDTPAEEKATAAGITPQISPQGGEHFFFGLVVTQADQVKNIPAFSPDREEYLEYDISQLVYSVQQFDRRKLGLLTSLPLQGTSPQDMQLMMMMHRKPQPGQFVTSQWEQTFQIVKVEPAATELPADLDVLAVIHPENLSPKLQFAIDQFLLAGKPVFLAVDPASQYFKQQGGQEAMFSGAPQPDVSSNLPRLLNAYGIAYDPQMVVGDPENAAELQNPQTEEIARYPTWLSLGRENFNTSALPTAELKSLIFVEAGSLAHKAGSRLIFDPLVQTSAQAGEIPAMMLKFAQPEDIARQITASGKKTIAALVTGKFPSAFPAGAPPDETKPDTTGKKAPAPAGTPAKTAALKESKTTSTLLVVADTDWLFDDYSVHKYNLFGRTAVEPFNDNLAFAANTVEFLGGSPDLISIRGKGSSFRPFTVIRRMEGEAQAKYQEKLNALDARLSAVQKKLGEIQGKKTEGNRLIATPEVAKVIGDFQKQQAALRGERREIRLALRENIDTLENGLIVINLFVSPFLVGIFGVWFHRRRGK